MHPTRHTQLEAQGWRVGSVAEFLDLTPEEALLVEMRLALSDLLRSRREQRMTQVELADRLAVSPEQIVTAEAGDGTVEIEWLLRAILTVGATPEEIGAAIARVQR
ncbi:MAG: transcriptional regulator [Chloroflexaceae bacterium]